MTKDTENALEIIAPMAELFNIKLAADDDFLYLNYQAIGITANSTKATVKEFIGYMIVYYNANFRDIDLDDDQLDTIRRYWYSDAQVAQLRGKPHDE